MPKQQKRCVCTQPSAPTMSPDYSKISNTSLRVVEYMLPKISAYLKRLQPEVSVLRADEPFIIAEYGSADGANSAPLFEAVVAQLHASNPALKIKLIYIDLSAPELFDRFWDQSALSKLPYVSSQYLRRSFYEPFPALAGKVRFGYSSTALHWMDSNTVPPGFFKHAQGIHPSQLAAAEREKFHQKWESDWRAFLKETSAALAPGGALFLAQLTDLGGDNWPASAAYNHLRDICLEMREEGLLTREQAAAIFVRSYFATPAQIKSLLGEPAAKKLFSVKSCESLTIPCSYYAKSKDNLSDPQEKAWLAATLSCVVRAWGESSLRGGLDNQALLDEIFNRLRAKFYDTPRGLPYQYSLLELLKN